MKRPNPNPFTIMRKEELKEGETYNIRVKVKEIIGDCLDVLTIDEHGEIASQLALDVEDAVAFSPVANESKYDPCRNGDKAKPRIINGRENQKMPLNVIFTVIGDEDEYVAVPVEYMSPSRRLLTSATVHAVWLELVTPVEEMGPWTLDEDDPLFWGIARAGGNPVMLPRDYFSKEAAEAECARLNDEYRKEMGNV